MTEPHFSAQDHRFMAHALDLARHGWYTTHPNPRVGCVIVRDGVVVGEGWHERAGQAHAEIHALRQAGEAARGATVYVTLEPCAHVGLTPPCVDALVKASVSRVIAAMVDPNPKVAGRGLQHLQQAGIATACGLLEQQARALNAGFISSMERQRPWVRLKMAMSLDGRTAMASGESQWITGAAARQDVQFWRAQASAVLTGIGTVLQDDPALTVRLTAQALGIEAMQAVPRQPTRIVLDSNLRIPLTAKLLHLAGDTVIYTVSQEAEKRAALEQIGVKVQVLGRTQLDLTAVLSALTQVGLHEVHVECGATLAGALMGQGWVDELLIYIAPHLMGSSARPLLELPLAQMQQRLGLTIHDIRAVGDDWRIIARPQ